MMPIGSELLFASTAPGRISHQKEIGQRRYASVRISTVRAIWLNGSSIRSNSVGAPRRATINSLPTTWPSSSSRQYGSGCALMRLRPSQDADGARHLKKSDGVYREGVCVRCPCLHARNSGDDDHASTSACSKIFMPNHRFGEGA